MTATPETLHGSMLVSDAVIFFKHAARHRSYPVVDEAGRPIALVSRSDALRWTQAEVDVEVTIGEQLSDASMRIAFPTTPASDVANMMIAEDVGRICVVLPEDGALVGLIARCNLLQPRAEHRRDERGRTRRGYGRKRRYPSLIRDRLIRIIASEAGAWVDPC